MKFVFEKFDEIEKDRLEKKKQLMTDLQNEARLDRQEQYSKRNCLLLHWIKENNEKTENLLLEVINKKLDESINESDRPHRNRYHRIGRRNNTKPRAVIIKFAMYNNRRKVFLNKKKLKGCRLSITSLWKALYILEWQN